MNATIEELIRLSEENPLPADHTSSHWLLHGENTVVERVGEEIVLQGSGFGSMRSSKNPLATAARVLERLSYRSVTTKLDSYPAVWSKAKRLAGDLSFDLTYNVWNQAMAMAVLMDHWQEHNLSPRVFALIGDGHGFLGALIKRHFPESRIYQIDLPKVLVFQARTHELAASGTLVSLTHHENWSEAGEIFFVAPQHAELIPENIDCSVNMSSMGEMSEASIAGYFTLMRHRSSPDSRFYCVNRLEKRLPDDQITRFYDYPWSDDDKIFIDEPCPYYTHVISRDPSGNGPRFVGLRIPFVNHFDGAMMHRMVHLAPAND
jgi:hypothetical protein